MRIRVNLGQDLQGFARLWERIHKDSLRLCVEDLQGFVRL